MSGFRSRLNALLPAAAAALLLAACAGEQPRVDEPADGPSTRDLKAEDVVDAVPRAEPPAREVGRSPWGLWNRHR